MPVEFLQLLFFMMVGHALADYPLQGPFIAANKCRRTGDKHVPWWHALTAHALIHGGAVALVTGSVLLGVLETACHFAIDVLKNERKINIHTDQALHVLCKVVWASLAVTIF